MDNDDPFGSKALARSLARESNALGKNLARESQMLGNNLAMNPLGTQQRKIERDSKRTFSKTVQNHVWNNQDGKCARCKTQLKPSSTHYDHIKQWADGGKSNELNCEALCANCHSDKTNEDRLKKQRKKRVVKSQQKDFAWQT